MVTKPYSTLQVSLLFSICQIINTFVISEGPTSHNQTTTTFCQQALLKVKAVIPEVSSCLRTSAGALQSLGVGSSGMLASILISLYASESLYLSLQKYLLT